MRIRSVLLLAVGAAALLVPAAPSNAAGARPCDAPYTGVVVFDGNGDLVTACVRTGDVVDPVREIAGRVREYPGEVTDWVHDARDTRCWSTPDGIACEALPPFPLPR